MSLNWFTDKKSSSNTIGENIYQEPKVEIAQTDEDEFWIEFSKELTRDTIKTLDERAKYIITTCASLIVIHFGLLISFKVQGGTFMVTPEFFLVISAALFAISFYPISKHIQMQSPSSVRDAYEHWIKWKLNGHHIGFGFFIAGLLAMAITAMVPS